MADFNYVTAAKDADTTDDEPIPITVDGREILVHRPSEGSLALLFAELADLEPGDEDSVEGRHIGAMVDFFFALLNPRDVGYLKKRLRARRDPFSVSSIEGIFHDMVKEWSGHPFDDAPDSTSQPASTGPTSEPGTPKSI